MSSIAVAADSTQSEHREEPKKTSDRKRTHNSENRELRKGKKKAASRTGKNKSTNSDDSGNEDDLDLSCELLPIIGYLGNRTQMIEHMFRSISRNKIRSMLPDIMKPLKTDELKKLCLEQLEVMSKKRLRRIVDGANPEMISSSGTEDSTDDETKIDCLLGDEPSAVEEQDAQNSPPMESTETDEQRGNCAQISSPCNEPNVVTSVARQEAPPAAQHSQFSRLVPIELETADSHSFGEYEEGELRDESPPPPPASPPVSPPASPPASPVTQHSTSSASPISSPETSPVTTTTTAAAVSSTEGTLQPTRVVQASAKPRATSGSGSLTLHQMEIVELEMRARAIKAMLRAHSEKKRRLNIEQELLNSQRS